MGIFESFTPDMVKNLIVYVGIFYILYDAWRNFPYIFQKPEKHKYIRLAEFIFNSCKRGFFIFLIYLLFDFIINI